MRIFMWALAVVALSSSAGASDFSGLSKPEFARMMLLSPRRAMEAQCTALARAQARLGKGVQPADAEGFAKEVVNPLIAEIGDSVAANDLVDGRRFGPRDLDSADDIKLRVETMEAMAVKCAPLFEAYRAGGASALSARLQPSGGLIPLLPIDQCVAIASTAAGSGGTSPFQLADVVEIRSELEGRMGKTQRAAFDASVDAAKARLARDKPSPDWIETRSVACLATFAKAFAETKTD